MIDIEEIKKSAIESFKDDIKVIDGIQWVPVTDAKAAIGFALSDTIGSHKVDNNEVASTSEILDMVKEVLDQASPFNLEIEVIGFALLALKQNPTLTISQALESGLAEWDV